MTTTSDNAAPVAGGRVRTAVAVHVERQTRFDNADLGEHGPEQAIPVAVTVAQTQAARFEVRKVSGAGPLPAGVDAFHGAGDAGAALNERLHFAQTNAPAAIAHWVQADRTTHLRKLTPAQAFLKPGRPAGYVYVCPTCRGACKVTCGSCNGRGENECHNCNGAGKKNCSHCGGMKRTNCSSCGGAGGGTQYYNVQHWNSSTGQYEHSSESRYESCSSCSGSGSKTCYTCDYAGKVQCYSCVGSGTINCGPCSATGKVACSPCQATGKLNERGDVHAVIERGLQLAIGTDDAILKALIATIDAAALPSYGALLTVEHAASGSTVLSTYRVRLDVLQAQLVAAERTFSIYGFGPLPTVLDYQNIAGHMLEGDLAALEAGLKTGGRWPGRRNAGLLDAAASFLRSELNILIAEQVAITNAAPEALAAAVQAHFGGLVEASYIERTSTALQCALQRVYGAELAMPALWLSMACALAAAAMTVFSWPFGHWIHNGGVILASGAALWAMLEWFTRRHITRAFEPAIGARVVARIHASGSAKKWRAGAAAAGALAVAAGAIGTMQVPYVRDLHMAQLERRNAPQMLEQWFMQPQTDWRLRSYPPRHIVEHEAELGNWRAQLIVGWQLLLGADGVPKDVAAAGQWLEKAEAQAGPSAAWRAAKAIQALHEEATPEQLRAAAATLKDCADSASFVEARYWEARTYIDERSPLFDINRGNKALQWAADRGHAHAAMTLGQHYASGRGLPRQPKKARQYLRRAADAGLAEAAKVLDAQVISVNP